MNRKFEGKVALVTGGTTGIGLATARLLHGEGAQAIVTGRNPSTLASARASLEGVAEVLSSDSGDGAEITALVAHIEHHHGGLDAPFLHTSIKRTGGLAAIGAA